MKEKIVGAMIALAIGVYLFSGIKTIEMYPDSTPVLVSHSLMEYTMPRCVTEGLDAEWYISNPQALHHKATKLEMLPDVEIIKKGDVPKDYKANLKCKNTGGFIQNR